MRRRSIVSLLFLLFLLTSTHLSHAADPTPPAPRPADLYFLALDTLTWIKVDYIRG
jgi:hypothetical protein